LLAIGATSSLADEMDEANAIRQRIESYVAAYNRQDAAAVADLWSEDAVYVNRGTGERI
jgi:ketosteroid isomerase-like protein